jgi:hypothetical protein
MVRNRPRIKPVTNKRMEGGAFEYSLSIRGWSLDVAKVNGLRKLQSAGGEELSALMASVLDRAFKGEL